MTEQRGITGGHSGHVHHVVRKAALVDHLRTWHRGTDGTLRRTTMATMAWRLDELERAHARLHGDGIHTT